MVKIFKINIFFFKVVKTNKKQKKLFLLIPESIKLLSDLLRNNMETYYALE